MTLSEIYVEKIITTRKPVLSQLRMKVDTISKAKAKEAEGLKRFIVEQVYFYFRIYHMLRHPKTEYTTVFIYV